MDHETEMPKTDMPVEGEEMETTTPEAEGDTEEGEEMPAKGGEGDTEDTEEGEE